MLGLVMSVVGDLITGWLVVHSSHSDGDPVDMASVLAIALFALAAASQRPVGLREATTARQALASPRPGATRALTLAPYLAVTAVFGLLIAALSGDPLFPQLSLAFTAVIAGAPAQIALSAAQTEPQAGPSRRVSLIPRGAADGRGRGPGRVAAAVGKATNVSVELPPDG